MYMHKEKNQSIGVNVMEILTIIASLVLYVIIYLYIYLFLVY